MKYVGVFAAVLSLAWSTGALATEKAAPSPAKQVPGRQASAVDRLQLDPTAVTGNRELPKVMSIVPWKAAEPPAGPDRPMGTLIDEVLAPVDRDEFQREVSYYRDLTSRNSSIPLKDPTSSPGATRP
jgi:hypothetical protein